MNLVEEKKDQIINEVLEQFNQEGTGVVDIPYFLKKRLGEDSDSLNYRELLELLTTGYNLCYQPKPGARRYKLTSKGRQIITNGGWLVHLGTIKEEQEKVGKRQELEETNLQLQNNQIRYRVPENLLYIILPRIISSLIYFRYSDVSWNTASSDLIIELLKAF